MKKILLFILIFIIAFSCYNLSQIKIDFSVNYQKNDDKTLSTGYYEKEHITSEISNEILKLKGVLSDESKKYTVINLKEDGVNKYTDQLSVNSNVPFLKEIKVPQNINNSFEIEIYSNPEIDGEYQGAFYEQLYYERIKDEWKVKQPDYFTHNQNQFNSDKTNYLRFQELTDVYRKNKKIIDLSNEICKNATNDYDKVLLVHDYIIENIYYDKDALYTGDLKDQDPLDALDSKKTLCAGISRLTASLLRVQGIKALTVSGYAKGVDDDTDESVSNHSWNEVFIDNRWIVVDATWDLKNEFKDGKFIKSNTKNYRMFDADLYTFSYTHKIISYT